MCGVRRFQNARCNDKNCNLRFYQETLEIICVIYIQVGIKRQFRKMVLNRRFDVFREVIMNIAVLRDVTQKFADFRFEILAPTLKRSSVLLRQDQHVPPQRL